MESSNSQQDSTPSQEDRESMEESYRMSQQTSVVGALSTNSAESDEDTYKSANEKSDEENTTATTSYSGKPGAIELQQRVVKYQPPQPTPDVSSKIPSTDTEILGLWYQYINSSLYDKDGHSDTDVSEMTSSMRVVQWLEGNKKSSRAVRRKEKESKERRKFRKEHAVLLRQDDDKKISKSQQQQQQQDSSVRGPLSIRPSYVEFLQKISKGKAEPTLEELEKEWPPDSEMFKRIISTPVSTEKKEDTESEAAKQKIEKKSEASGKSKSSKKSKASSASGKGKKGKKKGKKSKSLRGSKGKGKGKKKGSAKRKGSPRSKGSAKSKGSSKASGGKKKAKGGKKKGKKRSIGSTASGKSQDKWRKETTDEDKVDTARKAQMRKSFAEAQIRQSVFAENFKKGSRKSVDGFGRALSRTLKKAEKPKCNIPAAIHLYYGERADFLTEGELEEIRQRLNRVRFA